MSRDPNFPDDLNISPSASTSLSEAALHGFDYSAQQDAIRKYGIAGRVWEAAYIMNTFISPPANIDLDPPFVTPEERGGPLNFLELGSGTGIVAACCMDHFGGTDMSLIVTDLPEVCPLLEGNLARYLSPAREARATPTLRVCPLAWGNYDQARDAVTRLQDVSSAFPYLSHIICSDLVYFPELLAPLLRTLLHLTSPPLVPAEDPTRSPKVVISYKTRSLAKESPFWAAFGLWFVFEPVLSRDLAPPGRHVAAPGEDDGRTVDVDAVGPEPGLGCAPWVRFGSANDGDYFVFVARRRPESFAWRVPLDDEELLGGVGAQGNETRKEDGTFESLLLMGLDA